MQLISTDDPVDSGTSNLSYPVIEGSSAGSPHLHTYLDIQRFTQTYVHSVLFVAGLLANALTCVTLLRMTMAPTCKTLITCLSITDFSACVFGLLHVVLDRLLVDNDVTKSPGHMSSGLVTVLTMKYIYLTCLAMSSVGIVLISVIKLYVFKQPLKAVRIFSPHRARRMVAGLFCAVVTVVSPLPLLILWSACSHDQISPICLDLLRRFPQLGHIEIYFYVLAMVFGPGSTVTNIIFSHLIKSRLRMSWKESQSMQHRLLQSPDARRQERRATRVNNMFLYVLFLHLALLTPFSLQIIATMVVKGLKMAAHLEESGLAILLQSVAATLLALVPCYNFWAYLATNKDFRKEVNQILHTTCAADTNVEAV